MKKIFLLMLVFLMVFSMESCSAGEEISLEETISVYNESCEDGNPEYKTDYHFDCESMQEFLDFIDNKGNIPYPYFPDEEKLWSDFEENAAFLEWLEEKEQIPIPVLSEKMFVRECYTYDNLYGFFISLDENNGLDNGVLHLNIAQIPSEMSGFSLEELIASYRRKHDNQEAHSDFITGDCKYGEYILYDRYLFQYTNGKYGTAEPVIYFRYDDYLIFVCDRRKPEAAQWDISFLDLVELEMYDIKED